MSKQEPRRPIVEVYVLLSELALSLKLAPLNQHFPNGCWEYQIDEHWWVALNGHQQNMKCSKGNEVRPFEAYIEFNGWPFGILDPYGGSMGAGTVANEKALLEALRQAIQKVKGQS